MKPRFPFAVLIGLIVHLAGTPLQANISARTVVTPWPRHSRGGRVGARHAQIIPSEAKCSSPPIFLHEVASIFCPDQENRGRSRAGPCSRSPSCWTASGCRVPSARASTVRSSKCRSNASSGPNTSARMLRDHHPSRSVLWGWPERLRKIGPIRSTGREAKSTRYTRSVGLEKAALAVRCTSSAGPLKLRAKSFRRSARPQRAGHECLRAGGGAGANPRAVWKRPATRKRLGLERREIYANGPEERQA